MGIRARLPYCEIPSTDLRSACRLRVSSAVALLGISLLRFVTEDDPSLTLHKKALQPLSLLREPTQKSCFPRPKTVFVQQRWFIFYGRALPYQPAVCFFPLSLAVIQGQAYYCYCDLLFAVEWVDRNHLYLTRFFARETVNFALFHIPCLAYIPTPN